MRKYVLAFPLVDQPTTKNQLAVILHFGLLHKCELRRCIEELQHFLLMASLRKPTSTAKNKNPVSGGITAWVERGDNKFSFSYPPGSLVHDHLLLFLRRHRVLPDLLQHGDKMPVYVDTSVVLSGDEYEFDSLVVAELQPGPEGKIRVKEEIAIH